MGLQIRVLRRMHEHEVAGGRCRSQYREQRQGGQPRFAGGVLPQCRRDGDHERRKKSGCERENAGIGNQAQQQRAFEIDRPGRRQPYSRHREYDQQIEFHLEADEEILVAAGKAAGGEQECRYRPHHRRQHAQHFPECQRTDRAIQQRAECRRYEIVPLPVVEQRIDPAIPRAPWQCGARCAPRTIRSIPEFRS